MPARLRGALPLLALPLVAAPAVAQGFEGAVTLKITSERGQMEMVQQVKGDKVRSEMNMGGRGGVILMDGAAMTMTMLMTSEKMYMTMPIGGSPMGGPPEPQPAPKITKLGTSETIAGRACDNYLVETERQKMEICAAKGLGFFMMGGGGGRRGGGPGLPNLRDAKVVADFKDGFYPLRITDVTSGRKPMMEVTKIEPKALDAALFQVPADYQQMSMPGGMGPGAGGPPGRP